ncbi:hypothetical protein H9P43_004108 [Blastocladiella emersonii ATCC 22665]|nr:hypothetical protein H9P43_004108 [Blastocladiella emersonii ATCC 22665]
MQPSSQPNRGVKRASSLAELRERQRKKQATPALVNPTLAVGAAASSASSAAAPRPSPATTTTRAAPKRQLLQPRSLSSNQPSVASIFASRNAAAARASAAAVAAASKPSSTSVSRSASESSLAGTAASSGSATPVAPRPTSADADADDEDEDEEEDEDEGVVDETAQATVRSSQFISRRRPHSAESPAATSPGDAHPFDFVPESSSTKSRARDPFALLRSLSSSGSPSTAADKAAKPAPALKRVKSATDWSELVRGVATLQVHGTTLSLGLSNVEAYRSGAIDDADDEADDAWDEEDVDGWANAQLSDADWDRDADEDGDDEYEDDDEERSAGRARLLDRVFGVDGDADDGAQSRFADDEASFRPSSGTGFGSSEDGIAALLDDQDMAMRVDAAPVAASTSTRRSRWSLVRRIAVYSSTPLDMLRPTDPPSAALLWHEAFDHFSGHPSFPANPHDPSVVRLYSHLHHYRFPSHPLSPASRAVVIRALTAQGAGDPAATAELAEYRALQRQWQAALTHLAARVAPDNGFYVVHGDSFTALVTRNGAALSKSTRGLRTQLRERGIEYFPAAGKHARERIRARNYHLAPDAETADGSDGDDAMDSVADPRDHDDEGMDSDGGDRVPLTVVRDTTDAHDELFVAHHGALAIPAASVPSLIAFLVDFPTWNARSARAADPTLPVLVSRTPFMHAATARAEVTRGGKVSGSVRGDQHWIQIDGWVFPGAVARIEEIVRGIVPTANVEVTVDERAEFVGRGIDETLYSG